MKGKKIGYAVFILFFFILCCVPSLGMLVGKQAQPAANEILAAPPSLFDPEGGWNSQVLQQATDYIADRFAFRQEMVSANGFLQAKLFGRSAADQVLVGKEDWLFYDETKGDYLRTQVLSQREIQGIARSLKLIQNSCEEQGIQFLFMTAPNKNSLYPQYMPDVGKPLEKEKNLTLLQRALEKEGVRYLDLESLFLQQDEILYFHGDSHWNNKGAAFARDWIMEALGRQEEMKWSQQPYTLKKTHLGDLYEMLYPKGKGLEEEVHFERDFAYEDVSGQEGDGDRMLIQTLCQGKEGALYMFRDSFGNALYPFLADSFGSSVFSRSIPYDVSGAVKSGADTLMIEIVERNISWLKTYVPLMQAPPADPQELGEAGSAEVCGSARAVIESPCDLEGCLKISGSYSLKEPGDDDRVLISGGGAWYEAFPIGSEEGELVFTAYLPLEENRGNWQILVGKNGLWSRIHVTIGEN